MKKSWSQYQIWWKITITITSRCPLPSNIGTKLCSKMPLVPLCILCFMFYVSFVLCFLGCLFFEVYKVLNLFNVREGFQKKHHKLLAQPPLTPTYLPNLGRLTVAICLLILNDLHGLKCERINIPQADIVNRL